ncbi:MAG: DUF4105 domain-containing protein [Reinekea sp.]
MSLNPPTENDFIDLGTSEQWLRQLYLNGRSGNKPNRRILSERFYFSDTPHIDPVAELKANYEALFSRLNHITDEHPLCRFPSRFLFIDRQFSLNSGIDPFTVCPKLNSWSLLETYSKIMITKVDSHFGNPASTFGHLIIRIGSDDERRNLLDTSINYGAHVPPNELMPVYIFKGITGGYTASISLEDFYHQDLVYSKTEFRDMWNYELNLTEFQKRIFLGHVWELLEQTSVYYFVKYNCAYAIAGILEVATGYEFVSENTLYYPPIRLFQDLSRYDANHPGMLIASQTYLPSQDKMLRNVLKSLNHDEMSTVKNYINAVNPDIEQWIQPYTADRQSYILEVLLEYYDYMITGYPESGDESANRRIDIIKARLQRPAGKKLSFETIEPPARPPGETTRTTKFGFGLQYSEDQFSGQFSLTPFSLNPLDLGNSVFSELTILKTDVRFGNSLELSDFTLIKVAQRSDLKQYSIAKHPLSWTVDTGFNCLNNCDPHDGLQIKTGIGQSLSTGSVLNSILANALLEGRRVGISGEWELALPEVHKVSGVVSSEIYYPLSDSENADLRLTGKARYSFNPEHSIELSYSRLRERSTASLRWVWSPF